ncbi:MAG: hypothetical protein GY851_08265 [bacterium]|nr:hypothetical protein [bacterium]
MVEVPGEDGVAGLAGTGIASQRTDAGVAFLAENLPPTGWRTYHIGDAGSKPLVEQPVTVTDTGMDNGCVRVLLEDGLIRSIGTAGATKPQFASEDCSVGEVFIYEDAGCICRVLPEDVMASTEPLARSLDAARTVRVVESGPVRGIVETKYELDWGTFVHRVILEAGASHVAFETTVDWRPGKEGGRRVRVAFPTAFQSASVLCDSPFAVTERAPGHMIRPVNGWMSLNGAGGSASLIHQGTCSVQSADDVLWMTLFRSVRANDDREKGGICWDVDGDEALEPGTNTFRYWVRPGDSGWEEAGMPRLALELNMPFPVTREDRRSASLPSEAWNVVVEPQEIVMSALTPTANAGEYLLRLYNPGGGEVGGTVRVRAGDTQVVNFSPYEIKNVTIRS